MMWNEEEEEADDKNKSSSSGSDESNVTTENERLRMLFDSCDQDSDGFLDSHDFLYMCSRLKMADSAADIMEQLGMRGDSLVSFDDFIRCKHQVMAESHPGCCDELGTSRTIHPLCASVMSHSANWSDGGKSLMTDSFNQRATGHGATPVTSWLTMSSDNSLGAYSGKPDSADYDSGARDLSPESAACDYCVGDAEQSLPLTPDDGYTTATKDYVMKMSSKYARLQDHRDRSIPPDYLSVDLERKFSKMQNENARLEEEYEDRLEQTVLRYEERITELHSVIAELRKKIDRHNSNFINVL